MKYQTTRRISQIFFLVVLVYGGFLISQAFDIMVDPLPRGTEGETELVQAYLPVRSCRYAEPKPTLFTSCFLKYALELPLYSPPLYALAIPIILFLLLAIVFGRMMCGWMCPLGFMSDLLDSLRRRLKIDRMQFSEKFDSIIYYTRYAWLLALIFLAIALVLPFAEGFFMSKNYYQVLCQTCPSRLILPLLGGKLPTAPSFLNGATSFFSILSILFAGVFFFGLAWTRAWCRLCPNGSLTSLFNKGALMKKTKDVQACTKCGVCKRVCPFNNTYMYEEKTNKDISNTRCIYCLNCVEKCPEEGCLQLNFLNKTIASSRFK